MARVLASCGAIVALIVFPLAAWSEGEESEPSDRWVPSLAASLLVYDYKAEGTIESSIRYAASGRRGGTTIPVFQLGVGIMSPSFDGLPAAPRLTAFAGAFVGPDQTISVAGVGEFETGQPESSVASDLGRPLNQQRQPEEFPGQGSELLGTRQVAGWYMGLGVAFDVPLRDSILRLTPTVNYYGEGVAIEGVVVSVTGGPGAYTIHRPEVSDEELFHYLGPGIEAELILIRGDKLSLGVFGQLNYVWLIGDGTITQSDPASLTTFRYQAMPNSFRGGGGIRLSWHSAFE
jgi:hypothetical protein